VRRAFIRRASQEVDGLALVENVVASLHSARRDEHTLLHEVVETLTAAGLACAIDVDSEDGVRVRHALTTADERVDVVIARHVERAMTERRPICGVTAELSAAALDWLLCTPIDDDEHALGALTVYGVEGARQLPSLSLIRTLAEVIAVALSSVRREAALRAALGRRDVAMETVAHDLKNPIGVVLMTSRAVAPTVADVPEAVVGFESIDRNARYALSLVRDILEAAVMNGERITLRRQPCEAATLVTEVLTAIEPRVAAKRLRLHRRFARAPAPVFVDARRILQVLFNLVGNAVKFTPRNGSITVSVERRGAETAFSVKDSGPGIGPEQIAHVFERFWRGEDASGSGTGLGLTIARGIVEAHGGAIWIESELGHGANVVFTLP
jgi:signal transduction histidine kinase